MKIEELEAEKEIIGGLVTKSKIAFDLLQIRPMYLQNKINQEILEGLIKCYEAEKIISNSNFLLYCTNQSEENKRVLLDNISEIIADYSEPLSQEFRTSFMASQVIVFNDYKKRYVNDLTIKLNNNQITLEEYSNKISKMNDAKINFGTEVISEEDIRDGLRTSKQGIELRNFPMLSQKLKLVQGDFLMIGASTGVGKSGLLLNLMNDLMRDYQCIYFNMEMSKSTIYKRIISIKSDIPISELETPQTEYQQELIEKAIKEVVRDKIVVEHKATYLNEIKTVLRTLKNDNKHTIIFLDHIGLIKSNIGKSQYEQMTDIAKQLRQICLDYDCTIISACQLNRSSYNSTELSLSMLKDSGELENSSSKVLLLYKDKTDNVEDIKNTKMIVEIVKNRDGMLGKLNFTYDKTKQIFKEEWNNGNAYK